MGAKRDRRYTRARFYGRPEEVSADEGYATSRFGTLGYVQAYFIYEYDNTYTVDAALEHPDRFTAVVVLDPMDPDSHRGRARRGGTPRELYTKLVEVFGAKRIMWSSNYPAHPHLGGVKERLDISKKELGFLSEEDRAWILGKPRSLSTPH